MGFVMDAYTDGQDHQTVRKVCDASIDAVRNPGSPRPKGECVVGEMTRQCVKLTLVSVFFNVTALTLDS